MPEEAKPADQQQQQQQPNTDLNAGSSEPPRPPSPADDMYPDGGIPDQQQQAQQNQPGAAETGAGNGTEGQNNEDGDEQEFVESFSQLAEHIDVDEEFLLGLKVSKTVDGNQTETTLGDLLKSAQISDAAERRLQESKTLRQEANQLKVDAQNKANADLQQTQALLEAAEVLVMGGYDANKLEALKQSDFDQYQRVKDALQNRANAVNVLKQKVNERLNAGPSQEFIQERNQALINAFPYFSEKENAQRLGQYILEQGFTQQEITSSADGRLLVIAEKARLYDELQAKGAQAQKQVRKLPKRLNPGTAKSSQPAANSDDPASIMYPNMK
ncbi:MAG: hypothetical protein AAF529_17580 [Pseudomonadota bacterium]